MQQVSNCFPDLMVFPFITVGGKVLYDHFLDFSEACLLDLLLNYGIYFLVNWFSSVFLKFVSLKRWISCVLLDNSGS